jgi:hypothetical protein
MRMLFRKRAAVLAERKVGSSISAVKWLRTCIKSGRRAPAITNEKIEWLVLAMPRGKYSSLLSCQNFLAGEDGLGACGEREAGAAVMID